MGTSLGNPARPLDDSITAIAVGNDSDWIHVSPSTEHSVLDLPESLTLLLLKRTVNRAALTEWTHRNKAGNRLALVCRQWWQALTPDPASHLEVPLELQRRATVTKVNVQQAASWWIAVQCHGVEDEDIMELAARCRGLSSLDVSYCTKLTDGGLMHVADCCPELASLYITGCSGLTDELLLYTAKRCHGLLVLSLTCPCVYSEREEMMHQIMAQRQGRVFVKPSLFTFGALRQVLAARSVVLSALAASLPALHAAAPAVSVVAFSQYCVTRVRCEIHVSTEMLHVLYRSRNCCPSAKYFHELS